MGYDIRDYVPEDLKKLFDIVGEKRYKKIVRIYGGTLIYIPKVISFARARRNEEIYKDYLDGVSFRVLSDKWNLSINALRTIVRAKKKERMALGKMDKGSGSDVRGGGEEVGSEDVSDEDEDEDEWSWW